jgi:hypothetical protein
MELALEKLPNKLPDFLLIPRSNLCCMYFGSSGRTRTVSPHATPCAKPLSFFRKYFENQQLRRFPMAITTSSRIAKNRANWHLGGTKAVHFGWVTGALKLVPDEWQLFEIEHRRAGSGHCNLLPVCSILPKCFVFNTPEVGVFGTASAVSKV